MAVITLNITIPDAEVPRFVAAARNAWGQLETSPGVFRNKTQAELVTELQTRTRQALIDMVKRYEKDVAKATAEAAVVDLTAS